MGVIKIVVAIIIGSLVGGFTVSETIKSFKNEEYFWVGTFGTMTIALNALLIDYVLYQCFIY